MYRAIFLDQLLTSYTSCLNTIIVVCLDVNCVIYTALKLIQSAQLGSEVWDMSGIYQTPQTVISFTFYYLIQVLFLSSTF